MPKPDLLRDTKKLAETIKARFTPPEFIPGCVVKSVTDKDLYATDNGWIEAVCGQHNQQRCRWRGQYAGVAVDDYVDVLYFADRKLFEVYGFGGTGAAPGSGGNVWPQPGKLMHWDISENTSTEYDTIADVIAASPASGDAVVFGEGTFACDEQDFPVGVHLIGSGIDITILDTTTDEIDYACSFSTCSVFNLTIKNVADYTGRMYAAKGTSATLIQVKILAHNVFGGHATSLELLSGEDLINCDITGISTTNTSDIGVSTTSTVNIYGGQYVGNAPIDNASGTIILNSVPVFTGTPNSVVGGGTIRGVYQKSTGQLTFVDSSVYPPMNLTERSSAPSTPSTGDIYLDDGTNTDSGNPGLRRYTGAVWEDIGGGGGGSNIWADAGKVNISTTEYASWTLANAALGAGDQAIIGEGSQTSTAESVADGADIRGSGIDVSVLTGTGLQTLILNDGTNVLQDFNVENTATGGRIALRIGSSGGADVTCINVKGKSTATSGTATAISIYRSDVKLIDCLGEASGGGTNYALYVDDSATGTTTQVYGGDYTGDVTATGANATLELFGPRITGTLTAASSATIRGWYFDSNGKMRDASDGNLVYHLITNTTSNDIYKGGSLSDLDFVATIASLVDADTITYNAPSSGDEANLVPASTSQIAKMVLHNTTRGTDALISNCTTGTNTIDFVTAYPASSQVGDTITIRSQTNTDNSHGAYYADFEFVSGVAADSAYFSAYAAYRDTGAGGELVLIHPYEAYAASKRNNFRAPVANMFGSTNFVAVSIISDRFCSSWTASGSNTGTFVLRLFGEGVTIG
jgi:hypothetical protein